MGFYNLLQWIVNTAVMDCTVYCNGLYSLLAESVLVFSTKVLNHTVKTY